MATRSVSRRFSLSGQVANRNLGAKPCLRGMRVTGGMIVGLVAVGHTLGEILGSYPYLEDEDIRQALTYAGIVVLAL